MNNEMNVKEIVKEKYGQIAAQTKETGCCTCSCGPQIIDVNMIGDAYDGVEGHIADADLGLGCGLPTEYAGIKKGDTVLDLGCGAGNDVFIARSLTGAEGKVIGVDMTTEMIEKARRNNAKLGFTNVEFRHGEIESLPVESLSVDVVVSNCVLNLVPNKEKSFAEIYRVLKPGARFCISDIVLSGSLPEELRRSAELYAGCVAGAVQKDDYLGIIEQAGFRNIRIEKSRKIELPDKLLARYLGKEEITAFKSEAGLFSITVTAEKEK